MRCGDLRSIGTWHTHVGHERVLSRTIYGYAGGDREETMVDFKDLSEEQRAKVAGAGTAEDLVRIAMEEGYELTDDELEQISGGGIWLPGVECPYCGGPTSRTSYGIRYCLECGASVPDVG